ncbi:hypothetical protein [Corynebacterium sp. HS2168-gen11]|uniref:hypothetical protein n=1 Tax=Corynebacterium sp. HS2168-gen11 TaxID=2974027 RepID=UPI00216B5356|nr:hypothetical protein [Corynebacterium sp. HS2168-gen11]MCS4536484.1 hypothetical protein [Corynebacterium sp. HS2168-gen11]
MYGLLWDALPGPIWVKIILVAIILVAVFLLLMEYIFPWVSSLMPYNDIAV